MTRLISMQQVYGLREGDKLKVTHPIFEVEKDYAGAIVTLKEISNQGYLVVQTEHGFTIPMHPECLSIL